MNGVDWFELIVLMRSWKRMSRLVSIMRVLL